MPPKEKPTFDTTPSLAPNGLEHIPGVDMALMARAVRALPDLKASGMPLIMDALAQRHGAEHVVWAEHVQQGRDIVAFLEDPEHHPTPGLIEAAGKMGISVPKICRLTLESEEEFRRTMDLAQGAYYMSELGKEAVADRHAYYATEEMSELIIAGAGRDVRDLALTVADLPSPSGVLFLSRPEGRSIILWWAVGADGNSIWATTKSLKYLMHCLELEPSGDIIAWHFYAMARLSAPGSDTPPSDIEVIHPFADSVTNSEDSPFDSSDTSHVLPLLFSFAHMLHQDVARAERQATPPAPVIDKRGRRRFRKDEVTYLYLNRSRSSTGTASGTREYSRRWVVRGHWRRQWYPSEQRHKPKWIMEYIAGPEDAPLTHRDRVTIVNGPPGD